jgi:type IV secretory pathway VirJ component
MKRFVALLLLWSALQTSLTANAGERVADGTLHAEGPASVPDSIRDLPLYEVPATGEGQTLSLLITGDGGWAGLARQVSAGLARKGISVVGLSSLRYFWHSRTPDVAAHDVAEVLRHYLASWHRTRIVLIGYSSGADVLPFIVSRLPQDLRARVVSVNLVGPSANAGFEISVADWFHAAPKSSLPVAPELSRIGSVRMLCIYGEGEKDSLCPMLAQREVTSVRIGSGHHFSGEYGALTEKIAAFASHGSAR